MLVVESEFDALAVCYAAGDFVFSVAIGGSAKKPDNITDFLAKQQDITLLICLDNDGSGAQSSAKWQKLYPHAKPYSVPVGKDIGEAIAQGLDVRSWLAEFNPANKWRKEDKKLIDWFMAYAKKHATKLAHKPIEREVLLGPQSPRAITGELQRGLKLMKMLVEAETKNFL